MHGLLEFDCRSLWFVHVEFGADGNGSAGRFVSFVEFRSTLVG